MKERPILFSAPMVRTILDGTKTQTRRIVTQQPTNGWAFDGTYGRITSAHQKKDKFGAFIRCGVGTDFPEVDLTPCRYGMPGDRLWVRETCRTEELDSGEDGVRYLADNAWHAIDNTQAAADQWLVLNTYRGKKAATVPPIHMPRWASRILLEVNGVRVERLQDISDADAIAEGCDFKDFNSAVSSEPSHRSAYARLWDFINGTGSWEANPWVWVVEFKRIQPC